MNLYAAVLFVHVSGDISLFIGMGTQLLTLVALRRVSSVEQVRALSCLITMSDVIGVTGSLLTIASGLYMALTVWGLQTGWIAVALASIVLLMPILIGGVIEPRTRAIVRMSREIPDGPIPEQLSTHIHDPVLGTALHTSGAIVLGIVFLMTTKPSLTGSVAAMIIALALGLASGIPLFRAGRARTTERSQSS